MITKGNVTLYECEFCKKKLFLKHAMVSHESLCSKNPLNASACAGCVHLEETVVEYESQYLDDEGCGETKRTTGFKCGKLNIHMYPQLCVRRGLVKRYPETFKDKIVMPHICDHYHFIADSRLIEEII